jgi:hypothetical protein
MAVDLTVDERAVIAVRKAMLLEADGKALRLDLLKDMRDAVAPAVPELQAAVRRLPSMDPPSTPDLRDAVARQIKVGAALGGKYPGAKINVGTKQDPRGFRFAGRRLNKPKGWRHPVFGRKDDPWVQQYGQQGVRWFEPTILKDKAEYREGVRKAVDAMAERIAARVRRGQK